MFDSFSFQKYSSNNPFVNHDDDSLLNEYHISENNSLASVHQNTASIYSVLPLLVTFIHPSDALACALVDKQFKNLAYKIIWKEPNFKKLSHIHNELYMFNRFLKHLPSIKEETLKQIKTINVSGIEQSLYEGVKFDFFDLITKYCTGLESLDISHADYFTRKSMPSDEYWQLPHLTTLDLSFCSQVNDDMIVSIARGCRKLEYVRLDHLSRHKGKGLACIAAECDMLKSVSVRFNPLLEDQALIALGKFRHIRLLELDITGCKKISSVGLEVLARYAAHMERLSLAQTSCQLSDLRKFVCISRRTRFLDISSCKKLEGERHALAEWIWNTELHQLDQLVLESSIVKAICKIHKIQLIDVLLHVRQVSHLTVINLPEHTPLAYLDTLLEVFPLLKYITFKRNYFQTDFLLGTYRTPSPEDQDYITDITVKKFNSQQSRVVVSMVHERENDIDCSPVNW